MFLQENSHNLDYLLNIKIKGKSSGFSEELQYTINVVKVSETINIEFIIS